MASHTGLRTDSATDDEFAEQMLRVLAVQRSLGGIAYPLTLRKLGQLTDAKASAKQIAQVAGKKKFQAAAIVARKSELDSPVVLIDDVTLLAESPLTLRYALTLFAKNKTKAHTVADLKKKLTCRAQNILQKQFQLVVQQQMEQGRLPADVGFVVATGGKPRLFLLENLQPTTWQQAILSQSEFSLKVNKAPLDKFPEQFDSAFRRLDRERGGYNFVSLECLRSALAEYPREEFDNQLRELRVARRFDLSGAGNRTDITPQQREAGISESGSLLLFATRIDR